MPYTAADYVDVWSSTTVLELLRETIWLILTSSEFTAPWVGGAETVHIPVPDWSGDVAGEGVVAEARQRGGNWADARVGKQDLIAFARTGGFTSSNKVIWEDAIELPWPAVERTRRRQTYEMRKQIDKHIFDRISSDAKSGTVEVYGSNANSINRETGRAANNNARGLPRQILLDYRTKLQRADVDGPGDSVGQRYCVMAPEVFAVLLDDMEARQYGWDELTADLLRNNSILAGRGFRGRLYGIDVFSWTGIPKPTDGADWINICGVMQAQTSAIRAPLVQYFTPEANQITDEPAHLLRQAGDVGHQAIAPELMTRAAIDGGA